MLIDICTFQATISADCEQGFSLMNNIKVKSRDRLDNTHWDRLTQIKLYLNAGKTIDLHKAYTMWKKSKDQRVKLLKLLLSFQCLNKLKNLE